MQETVRSAPDLRDMPLRTLPMPTDDEALRRSLERQRRHDLSLLRAFVSYDA